MKECCYVFYLKKADFDFILYMRVICQIRRSPIGSWNEYSQWRIL